MLQHHIQRQVLEVITPSMQDREEVTEQVSGIFQDEVLPELSALFDRLAPAGTVLNLNQLQIDVCCSQEELESKLPALVLAAITKEIELLLKTPITALGRQENAVQHWQGPMAAVQAFTHFLETGQLPWHMPKQDMVVLEENIATEALAVLAKRLKAKPLSGNAVKRLLWQCSPGFLVALVLELMPGLSKQAAQIIFSSKALEKLQLYVLRLALQPSDLNSVNAEAVAVLNKIKTNDSAIIAKKIMTPDTSNFKDKESSILPPQDTEEPLYLSNAGLVLLAHLLETLFDHFGYLQAGQFVDQQSQYRAVHLVHYLATGEEMADETEQSMAKFLCGLPLKQPTPKEIILRKEEKEEAQQLLQLIIDNWPKMQGSPIGGLQQAFLQRSGKLYGKNGNWHIQVEKDTLDVLLGFLPWGIGVVHLPWLEGMVWVEW